MIIELGFGFVLGFEYLVNVELGFMGVGVGVVVIIEDIELFLCCVVIEKV